MTLFYSRWKTRKKTTIAWAILSLPPPFTIVLQAQDPLLNYTVSHTNRLSSSILFCLFFGLSLNVTSSRFSMIPKINLISWIIHTPMVPRSPSKHNITLKIWSSRGRLPSAGHRRVWVWERLVREGRHWGKEGDGARHAQFLLPLPSHSSLLVPWEKHKQGEKGERWAFEFLLLSRNSLLSVELPSPLPLLQGNADLKYKLTVEIKQKLCLSFSHCTLEPSRVLPTQ